MYEYCAEFVACSGKYRLVGVDWASGIPRIVSEHDDIIDAIRQRDFLNKLVSDYFCPIGNMDYQVHDDKGVEQGIAIPPNQWSRDFFCGMHSGMPLCCVLWYCDCWAGNLSDQFRIVNMVYGCDLGEWKQSKNISAGYVMCPDCIADWVEKKSEPIQPKSCNCSGRIPWPKPGQFKVIQVDYRGVKMTETEAGVYDSKKEALDQAATLVVTKNVQNSLEDKTEVLVNAFVVDEFGNCWF